MIQRWDVVTIGNLSRNRYWGESDAVAVRAALCTSTLVRGEGFRLLVDPPLAEPAQMARELDRRTGLKPDAVTHVFLTHEHGDHLAGLENFPEAVWLAGARVAARVNEAGRHSRPVRPVEGTFLAGIEALPTPGHTPDHHSLLFTCEGMVVVIAGDAVMTRDFWAERQGFHNSADFLQAARTMEELAAVADLIVPGHDNYFPVRPFSGAGRRRR